MISFSHKVGSSQKCLFSLLAVAEKGVFEPELSKSRRMIWGPMLLSVQFFNGFASRPLVVVVVSDRCMPPYPGLATIPGNTLTLLFPEIKDLAPGYIDPRRPELLVRNIFSNGCVIVFPPGTYQPCVVGLKNSEITVPRGSPPAKFGVIFAKGRLRPNK